MTVTYVDDLGQTPARVNRFTGEILINKRKWKKLPESTKKFILAHEKGHYILNTSDEFAADEYAFKQFAGTERKSLKKSIKAMDDVFSFTSPEQYERLNAQIKRALTYDVENGNKQALQILMEMNNYINSFDAAPAPGALLSSPGQGSALSSSPKRVFNRSYYMNIPVSAGLTPMYKVSAANNIVTVPVSTVPLLGANTFYPGGGGSWTPWDQSPMTETVQTEEKKEEIPVKILGMPKDIAYPVIGIIVVLLAVIFIKNK